MSSTSGKKRRSHSSSSEDSSSTSSSSSDEYKKSKVTSRKKSSKGSDDKNKRSGSYEKRSNEKKEKRSGKYESDENDDARKSRKSETSIQRTDQTRRRKHEEDDRRKHDGEHGRRAGSDYRDERRRDDRGRDERGRDERGRDERGRGRSNYFPQHRPASGRDRRDNRNGRRNRSRSRSFDHANAKWGRNDDNNSRNDDKSSKEKQKPNFGLSGKLTEETNTYKGVVIKYSEPPEARKPKRRWRLYPFKGDKALQTLYIHRESGYLIGRERTVVDLAVDHPSCSKQHAALQYRLVPFTREDGSVGKRVRPYLIDLDSANGTFINNKKIEPRKYVELLEKDVIKFGFSSREYVLLHENSKDEAQDDDVKIEEEEEVKKEKSV